VRCAEVRGPLAWTVGGPQRSERATFVVREGVGPPLLDRPVEPLTDLFTVVGDEVRGSECVPVLFAVRGDLGEHPSPLALDPRHRREWGVVLAPHDPDRIEFRTAVRWQGAAYARHPLAVLPTTEVDTYPLRCRSRPRCWDCRGESLHRAARGRLRAGSRASQSHPSGSPHTLAEFSLFKYVHQMDDAAGTLAHVCVQHAFRQGISTEELC
jgi:hypothetical protein